MLQKWERRASLTGAVFAILLVACFIVSGEAPGGETTGVDESAQEVVSFYTENDAEMFIAATLSGLGAVCLLFFVGSLGRVLESAGGAAAGLSAVARAGGVVAAVGVLIFAGLMFTLGDAADNLDSAATQALHALNADFFFLLAGGMATLLFATGLVAVRSRALPAWLGWTALVIAVAMFTPLGFFAFLVSVAWVFVASVGLAFGPGAARAAGLRAAPAAGLAGGLPIEGSRAGNGWPGVSGTGVACTDGRVRSLLRASSRRWFDASRVRNRAFRRCNHGHFSSSACEGPLRRPGDGLRPCRNGMALRRGAVATRSHQTRARRPCR